MSWRRKSFEVLPALSVRGENLRANLRVVTVAWMFGIAWMACIQGSQMTMFGRLLGFRDEHFGIMDAIPFAATFFQLVAAVVIERTGLRKYMFLTNASVHRMLWVVIAAVPLLLRPGPAAATTFLVVFGISCVLSHLATPSWRAWMGDLIPRRIRGRYFAARRLWAVPVQMAVVVAAGVLLDAFTVDQPSGTPVNRQTQPYLIWPICGLFVVGGVLGTIDILLFRKMREIASHPLSSPAPKRSSSPARSLGIALGELGSTITSPFRDRVFRHYAFFGMTVTFAMTVGKQFFWINALERLGYTKLGANIVFSVLGAASGLVLARPWGRLIDRWGCRPVLMLAALCAALGPVPWMLVPRGNVSAAYALGSVACIWGAGMFTGIMLAQTTVIMGFAESAGRSKNMAAFGVVVAVGGTLGGLSGGLIARALAFLKDTPLTLGPFEWVSYHVNFAVSALARAGSVLFLVGMPDPGAGRLRDMVRSFRFNAYGNVMTRLFWPVRALGQGLWQRSRRRNGENDRNGSD